MEKILPHLTDIETYTRRQGQISPTRNAALPGHRYHNNKKKKGTSRWIGVRKGYCDCSCYSTF